MKPAAALAVPGAGRSWSIALVVTLATFMELLDATVVNVALPHIAGSLGAGQDESSWVLTSYLVANAVAIPLSAWFSGLLGRKRFYMWCVGLFTLASLACGMAPTLEALLLFRVVQGLVGGGLQPCEQAILADSFPAERRGMAFAVAGVAMISAPMLGPTLGGLIIDHASWRWIFFVNIPIGCLSLVLTGLLIEDPPHARRQRDGGAADYIGLGLIVLALGSLQVVLDKGEREDWFDSPMIASLAAVALAAGAAAVLWELRHRQPVLDLRLLRSPSFAVANLLVFLLYVMVFSSTLLIPLMLQTHLGYTATLAGLVLSPGALVNLALMPVAGRLVTRLPSVLMICGGFAASGAALLYFSTFNLQTDAGTFTLARCLIAVGIPFAFVPINTVAFRGIDPSRSGHASALLAVSRNIGGSVGIAVAITYLTQRIQASHASLAAHVDAFSEPYREQISLLIAAQNAAGVTGPEAALRAPALLAQRVLGEQSAILAYMDGFALFGVVSLAAAAAALVLLGLCVRAPRRAAEPAAEAATAEPAQRVLAEAVALD
jgi:DHA2 family multidrug resistance protein